MQLTFTSRPRALQQREGQGQLLALPRSRVGRPQVPPAPGTAEGQAAKTPSATPSLREIEKMPGGGGASGRRGAASGAGCGGGGGGGEDGPPAHPPHSRGLRPGFGGRRSSPRLPASLIGSPLNSPSSRGSGAAIGGRGWGSADEPGRRGGGGRAGGSTGRKATRAGEVAPAAGLPERAGRLSGDAGRLC